MLTALSKLFGKSRQDRGQATPDGADMIQSILDTNSDALAVHDAAQNDTLPSVILKPIIRPGPLEAGWFGGQPMLPPDEAWPEIEGVPLNFLAQIDLARLPADIWSGLGPRDGHLVFFNHPDRCAPKVLHVSGDLVPRSADVPVPQHRWNDGADTHGFPHYNRFPVTAIAHKGQLPQPPISQVKWEDREMLDLTKPAHRPFDTASLGFLIEKMSQTIDLRLAQCGNQLKGNLKDEAKAAVRYIQDEATKTQVAFAAAVDAVEKQSFDANRAARFIDDISNLPLPGLTITRSADSKDADIEPKAMTLVDPENTDYAGRYLGDLDTHLFQCFVQDRDALPPLHRDRTERKCEAMAEKEFGGMSHAPHGFIYTPHGSGSPNEVLLELPSSNLTGWMWGDVYALVVLINRKALKRGKFDKVIGDITN
ncbi:MAG: DUF1963 domain-containing protein [Pseudomonadota bacterium]